MPLKAGLIGLGQMGKALATRLRSEGVELYAWNRTLTKARELDAIISDTPAAVVSKADIVILNLSDSGAVRDVMGRKDGLLSSGNLGGKTIIDTTTNNYADIEYFYSALAEKGAAYLEAPVAGSIIEAMTGSLTVMVSGAEEAYKAALPCLEKIGKDIFYLAAPGLATRAKLINNMLLGVFMASIAEAAVLAEKAGLDRATALEIFSKGAGGSSVLNAKKEKLQKEDFSPHFKTSLMHKDLKSLHDLAASLNAPIFTASMAKELFTLAMSKNTGEEDFSSVYKALKNL
jgi:3-hydroxyisobutyrate dehydrogenase